MLESTNLFNHNWYSCILRTEKLLLVVSFPGKFSLFISVLLGSITSEVLWCSSGCRQHQIPTTSVWIGTVDVLPVFSVRDLGVYIDSDVAMQSHVTATVRSCFAVLWQLRSMRRCLPQQALLTLIRALIISKVDYCCSVLVGVFGHLLDRLQSDTVLPLCYDIPPS